MPNIIDKTALLFKVYARLFAELSAQKKVDKSEICAKMIVLK